MGLKPRPSRTAFGTIKLVDDPPVTMDQIARAGEVQQAYWRRSKIGRPGKALWGNGKTSRS
ncbi:MULTISPECIES: hypothetical protein [unclassified Microcoleus]|uniref:hypothetical protein n=1 Tax=unclassified Microcoleus TaxID=2642155 RepID=UPI0025E9D10C|nr:MULTISPECIES: hypothetical protein [unclassified Microcoleus]